jgi:DNA repair protein RAD5
MYTDAKKNFERLSAKGLVGKNYTHILAMLMRFVSLFCSFYTVQLNSYSLRRAVLHPNLVLSAEDESDPRSSGEVDINSMIRRFSKDEGISDGNDSNVFAEGVLANLSDLESDGECPICLDVMLSPMIIPNCMHRWCAFFRSLL